MARSRVRSRDCPHPAARRRVVDVGRVHGAERLWRGVARRARRVRRGGHPRGARGRRRRAPSLGRHRRGRPAPRRARGGARALRRGRPRARRRPRDLARRRLTARPRIPRAVPARGARGVVRGGDARRRPRVRPRRVPRRLGARRRRGDRAPRRAPRLPRPRPGRGDVRRRRRQIAPGIKPRRRRRRRPALAPRPLPRRRRRRRRAAAAKSSRRAAPADRVGSHPLDPLWFGGAWGAVSGAWLGAIPTPLDWDRPWQRWPVAPVIGASVGFVAATWAAVVFSLAAATNRRRLSDGGDEANGRRGSKAGERGEGPEAKMSSASRGDARMRRGTTRGG